MAIGKSRLTIGLAVLVVAIIAIAWVNGGEKRLRPIEEPVSLPGTSQ